VLRDTLDGDDDDTLGKDDLGLVMVMAGVAAVLILSPRVTLGAARMISRSGRAGRAGARR
jgi:hypothetical protein